MYLFYLTIHCWVPNSIMISNSWSPPQEFSGALHLEIHNPISLSLVHLAYLLNILALRTFLQHWHIKNGQSSSTGFPLWKKFTLENGGERGRANGVCLKGNWMGHCHGARYWATKILRVAATWMGGGGNCGWREGELNGRVSRSHGKKS